LLLQDLKKVVSEVKKGPTKENIAQKPKNDGSQDTGFKLLFIKYDGSNYTVQNAKDILKKKSAVEKKVIIPGNSIDLKVDKGQLKQTLTDK